jgi:hypothetical protein
LVQNVGAALAPDRGVVIFVGRDVTSESVWVRAEGIGRIFQESRLWPTLTVSAAQKRSSITVDWRIAATGKPLEREATITQGRRIENGEIEISVDMPSMPMMHRIPKIIARPTGEQVEYTARFTLEMAGDWAAQIDVNQPQRTRVIKRFKVD